MEKFQGLKKEVSSDETKEKKEKLKNLGMKRKQFWAENFEFKLFRQIVEKLNELSQIVGFEVLIKTNWMKLTMSVSFVSIR